MYCSPECQRGDFEGGHRHLCKKLVSIALKWKELNDPFSLQFKRHRLALRLASGGVEPPSRWHFVRFIDGDVDNATASNLCYVELGEAVQHAQDWVVDWSLGLTAAEREVVLDGENLPLLVAAYGAKLEYEETRNTSWNPEVDNVQLFPVCDNGYEFARIYSAADRGPLAGVTLVAFNVPMPAFHEENCDNVGESVRDVCRAMDSLHCRAAQGIQVKETQVMHCPPLHWLLVRPVPEDEATLREDLCCRVSDAYLDAEERGEAKVLVLVPFLEGEDKNNYFNLVGVVSDLINSPMSSRGLSGSGLGAERRFRLLPERA